MRGGARIFSTTYIRDAVAAVLGRHGYRIPNQDTNYLVRVMVKSLGTMQELTLIGASSYPEHRYPLFASGTRAL